MNIYQQQLMDHYYHPRHKGTLAHPDFTSDVINPSCGDSISWQGRVQGTALEDLAFTGKGCVISQASASLLAEHVIRKSLHEIQHMTPADMIKLVGIELGPTRLRCALLALEALQTGIHTYLEGEHV
jgi:nitrogen fixation NifU-like protein